MVAENPEEECAPQEEITEKADKVGIYLYFKNYYFDSNDFENLEPKSVVDYQYKPLLKDIGQFQVAVVSENKVTLNDHWSGLA